MAQKPEKKLLLTITISEEGDEISALSEFATEMPYLRALIIVGQAAAGMTQMLVKMGTAKGLTEDEVLDNFLVGCEIKRAGVQGS